MPNKPPHFRPGGRTPEQAKKERDRARQKTRPDQEIQKLYRSPRWRALRKVVLARFPACVICQKYGRVTPSTVIDHINPHRGDMKLFWDLENLHGLCASCHSGTKRREENAARDKE